MLTSDLLLYAFKILNGVYPINHMFCALESHGIWNHQRLNPAPFTFIIRKSEGPGLKNKVKAEHQPSLQGRLTKKPKSRIPKKPSGKVAKQPVSLSPAILITAPIPALYHLSHSITGGSELEVVVEYGLSTDLLKHPRLVWSLKKMAPTTQNLSGMTIPEALSCEGCNSWVGKTKQLTLSKFFTKAHRTRFSCHSHCCTVCYRASQQQA